MPHRVTAFTVFGWLLIILVMVYVVGPLLNILVPLHD